jgi:hypothetical protein
MPRIRPRPGWWSATLALALGGLCIPLLAAKGGPPVDSPSAHASSSKPSSNSMSSVTDVTLPPYNAYGDGVHDDTDAIQGALDDVGVSGGICYLPVGTYLITNTLSVGSGTIVRGAGRGRTVLRGSPGAYPGRVVAGYWAYATLALVGRDHSTVENLTIDHMTNGTWANGIILAAEGASSDGVPTTYSTVQRCEIKAWPSHQYLIWNLRGEHNQILDNYLDGGTTSFDPSSEEEGIEIYGGEDILVSGNSVVNVGSHGIFSPSGDISLAARTGIMITSNSVLSCGTGICVMCGNQVQDSFSIENNIVEQSYSSGISITADALAVLRNWSIRANIIIGAGDAGIWLYGNSSAALVNVEVAGNTVLCGSGNNYGMAAFYWSNTDFLSNEVAYCYAGFYLVHSSRLSFKLNRTEQITTSSMALDGSSFVTVADNVFWGFNTGLQGYAGIYAEGLDDSVFQGNEFMHGGQDAYALYIASGNRDQVLANILLYTSAYDPPLVNGSVGGITLQWPAGSGILAAAPGGAKDEPSAWSVPVAGTSGTLAPGWLPLFGATQAGAVPQSGGGELNFLRADGLWTAPPTSSGTVSSIGLVLPPEFAVSGSPITSAGTLTAAWMVQGPSRVLASPVASGTPAFRALTALDIPTLSKSQIGDLEAITTIPTPLAVPKADQSATIADGWLSRNIARLDATNTFETGPQKAPGWVDIGRYNADDPRPFGWPRTAVNPLDDEFREAKISPGWSWHGGSSPSTADLSSYPSFLFLSNGGTPFSGFLQKTVNGPTSWSGKFDVAICVHAPQSQVANGVAIGLFVSDSQGTGKVLACFQSDFILPQEAVSEIADINSWKVPAPTIGSSLTEAPGRPVYLRLVRDQASRLFSYFSTDGMTWRGTSKVVIWGSSVCYAGLFVKTVSTNAAYPDSIVVDWFRVAAP